MPPSAACASLFWVHLLAVWLVLWLLQLHPLGAIADYYLPAVGLVATATIVTGTIQGFVGAWLDREDDPQLMRPMLWAPWYPVAYWIGMAAVVLRETIISLLRKPKEPSRWTVAREEELAEKKTP